MSQGINGFVRMKANVVLHASAACLEKREKRIAEERAKMVNDLMAQVRVKFWTRRRYQLTKLEAIKELQSSGDMWGSRWSDVELRGSRAAEDIAELWTAAQTVDPSSEMLITSIHAARLLKFINPTAPGAKQ